MLNERRYSLGGGEEIDYSVINHRTRRPIKNFIVLDLSAPHYPSRNSDIPFPLLHSDFYRIEALGNSKVRGDINVHKCQAWAVHASA